MSRRSNLLSGLVALAVLSLVSTAMAAEEPESEPQVGSTAADPFPTPRGLVLHGTHGFAVVVHPAEGRGERNRIEVLAEDAHGSVEYTAPGTDDEAGIQADFGRYGSIDMEWVPDGQVREVRIRCSEGVVRHFYDAGAYVGTLDFRGGNGFTSAKAQRIAWTPSWYTAEGTCPFSVSTARPSAGEVVEAQPRQAREPLHLFVYKPHRGAKVGYQARSVDTRGRVRVMRRADATGGPGSLSVSASDGLITGRLEPPTPFFGTGLFEREAHSKGRLRGDLGVEFPDHTKAALSGPDVTATLRFETIEIHGL